MKIYHYRSVENALLEIEGCTFRFADRTELNDPIEGYFDVVWKGDEIAWEGLFRNFICSLFMCRELFFVGGNEEELLEKDIVIFDVHSWDSVPLGKVLEKIGEDFLNDSLVKRCIHILSYEWKEKTPLKEAELSFWLYCVFFKAYNLCSEWYTQFKDVPEYMVHKLEIDDSLMDNLLRTLESETISEKEFSTVVKISVELMNDLAETTVINSYNTGDSVDCKRKRIGSELLLRFPLKYVEGLRQLLYPSSSVVCFSSDAVSSKMWGHYADNHKGVCLIYETTPHDGKEFLNLRSEEGAIDSAFEMTKVKYSDTPVKRNFFESLGLLNMKQIESWLISKDGKISSLMDIYSEKQKWREKYWKDCEEINCTKMLDWKDEKEYRLWINDSFGKIKFLRYSPECLKGVVFGTKTTPQNKAHVLHALESSGKILKDLQVFQARYDRDGHCIKIVEQRFFG